MGGAYGNGFIPHDRLIRVASGVNADGYWEHLFAPGTLAKWNALVADVLAHERVRLAVTVGWNAYRPYEAQVLAKRKHGANAAWPGTSSHGGFFNGRDTMAIDVGNWGLIGRDKFYAYARKHGFEPGVFSWEPWHIVDYSPWAAPAGGNATTFEPEPEQQGDIEMRVIYNTDNDDEARRRAAVGELSFQVLSPNMSGSERQVWGDPVNVNEQTWRQLKAAVNDRRKKAGLPAIT